MPTTQQQSNRSNLKIAGRCPITVFDFVVRRICFQIVCAGHSMHRRSLSHPVMARNLARAKECDTQVGCLRCRKLDYVAMPNLFRVRSIFNGQNYDATGNSMSATGGVEVCAARALGGCKWPHCLMAAGVPYSRRCVTSHSASVGRPTEYVAAGFGVGIMQLDESDEIQKSFGPCPSHVRDADTVDLITDLNKP